MGVINTIGFDRFPKQGENLNRKVEVCFNYDTSKTANGVIVREDIEEPRRTIIQLADGRYVLAGECQYTIVE